MFTISNYSKYKDRMALNEVISDIYLVQTDSLKSNNSYIDFFTRDNEYIVYSNGKKYGKKYHVVVGHYLKETQLD